MRKPKTIVMWGSENILGSSVEAFLSSHEDWKVVSILNNGDPGALIEAVGTIQPDIVVLNLICQSETNQIPMQIIQDYPGMKVIQISLEDNMIGVYSKQSFVMKEISNLISVIESEPGSQ